MSKEIQVTFKQAYSNLFAVLFDANDTDKAANNATETFDAPSTFYNNYAITLAVQPATEPNTFTYAADIPAWIPRKLLNVKIKQQTTAPQISLDSLNLATGVLAWGGSDVGLVFPASFEQIQEVLSETEIIKSQLDELFDLVNERCNGGSSPTPPSGDCDDNGIPFADFYELITSAQSISVDGQSVTERSVSEIIQADKYIKERAARCTNRGNGWASIGVARAIPPDGSGRC